MESSKIDVLTKLFEHNLYANVALIEICVGLNEEQLSFETNGGFGGIFPTVSHYVASEGGYLRRLLDQKSFWPEEMDWETCSMTDLLERAKLSGNKFIEIASQIDPTVKHSIDFPDEGPHFGKPFHFYNWTLLLQALNHSGEHRTHVKVLLTHLGIAHPDLSAWTYMEVEQGFV